MVQETYETLNKLFEQHGRCASANYMAGGMDLFFDVENFHLRNNKLCIEQFDSLLYIPEILSTRQFPIRRIIKKKIRSGKPFSLRFVP